MKIPFVSYTLAIFFMLVGVFLFFLDKEHPFVAIVIMIQSNFLMMQALYGAVMEMRNS